MTPKTLLMLVLRLRDALQDLDTWIFGKWESKLRDKVRREREVKQ
jgi:hypothetical protein